MEQNTAEKILDAAQSLIVMGGYNGFSYADISEAVGIRKASIHHHFPTKADLVASLLTRYEAQAKAGLAAVRDTIPSPAGQLQAYIGHWQACIADASRPFCVCAMLAGEMPLLPEEVAAGVRAHFDHLSAWLAAVLKDGVEQKLFHLEATAEDEAQSLMACVHGAMLSARAFGRPGMFPAIVAPQVTRLAA